jgi:hypothetical protein
MAALKAIGPRPLRRRVLQISRAILGFATAQLRLPGDGGGSPAQETSSAVGREIGCRSPQGCSVVGSDPVECKRSRVNRDVRQSPGEPASRMVMVPANSHVGD